MAERGRRYRGIKRRDTNHAATVKLLEQLPGLQVLDCSQFGDSYPDLELGAHGHWLKLELKFGRGDLRDGQRDFVRDARGPVAVCWSELEALELASAFVSWAARAPRFSFPGAGGNCG